MDGQEIAFESGNQYKHFGKQFDVISETGTVA
jgi:hypothetical protein